MEGVPQQKDANAELKELHDADQSDRIALHGNWENQELIQKWRENDAKRLERAYKIYEQYLSKTVTLDDEAIFNLALLLHHSHLQEDYLKARELAETTKDARGKLLSAQAEDRYLLNTGQKQKWGTQFRMGDKDEGQLQAPMQTDEESGITDEMRREKGVPPRAIQLAVHLGQQEWEPED